MCSIQNELAGVWDIHQAKPSGCLLHQPTNAESDFSHCSLAQPWFTLFEDKNDVMIWSRK